MACFFVNKYLIGHGCANTRQEIWDILLENIFQLYPQHPEFALHQSVKRQGDYLRKKLM